MTWKGTAAHEPLSLQILVRDAGPCCGGVYGGVRFGEAVCGEMVMTPDWIEGRVRDIEAMANDDEAAHGAEDELWEQVLEAIAKGETSDPAACAKAALKTTSIKFCRWCA